MNMLARSALALVAAAPSVVAQPCYTWSRSFTGQDFDQPPVCSAVFDDGTGPRLFLGGQMRQAGGATARSIVRLDPAGWNALGGGTTPDGGAVGVYALTVFDADGAGPGAPALYAGGLFEGMSGVPARGIARWTGAGWQTVGGGLFGSVKALAAYDDGSGPHLYAGGNLQLQNGGSVYGLARLNAGAWEAVPAWTGGTGVKALAAHDDGNGPALYAATFTGTVFRLAGGACTSTGAAVPTPANTGCFATYADSGGTRLYFGSGNQGYCLAAWDGASWTRVEIPGTSVGSAGVCDLVVWDDGAGSALYVLGDLQGSPDASMSGIAKYRNGQWSALGTGVRGTAAALTAKAIDDGGQASLFVAGSFTSAGGQPSRYAAVWTGAEWKARGRAFLGSGIASATWEDGTGVRTFAATTPTTGAGSVSEWDGTGWAATPGGVDSSITQMAGVSGGSTPGLYVAGPFGRALDGGGQPTIVAEGIARWDGSAWSGIGGFSRADSSSGNASALVAADLGDGPALYVGGNFSGVGGELLPYMASRAGGIWTGVGDGPNAQVHGLAAFDDGSGPATYAIGTFNRAGGQFALWCARRQGGVWSPAFGGLNGVPWSIVVHDDGSGPALYIGGEFDYSGVPSVARWNGSAWQPVGAGNYAWSAVRCLLSVQTPDGPVLYAGGQHVNQNSDGFPVLAWNGSAWSALPMASGEAKALAMHNDGSGPALYAAGSVPGGVVRLSGGSWQPVGSLDTSGNNWSSMASYDNGSGARLYVGGPATYISSLNAIHALLRWDGSAWSAPAGGIANASPTPTVYALTVHDEGTGPRLYVGGSFSTAGSQRALNLAVFDGSAWTIPSGTSGTIRAIRSSSEAGLPTLSLAGSFFRAGVTPASNIARYKDGAWSPLGAGVNSFVYTLAVHNDGSGTRLMAGGDFSSAGGAAAAHIAAWNGASWSTLGAGCEGEVFSLASLGGSLYAGGRFQAAGGQPIHALARWDGSAWSAVGGGISGGGGGANPPGVYALSVMDDGAGPALFAAGEFTSAGGFPAPRAARWSGSAWSSLDVGLGDTALASSVIPSAGGPTLVLSGTFNLAGGWQSIRTAAWQPCSQRAAPSCPADFNGDAFVDFFDYDDYVNCFETGSCPPGKTGDFNGDGFADFFDYDDFVAAFEAGC